MEILLVAKSKFQNLLVDKEIIQDMDSMRLLYIPLIFHFVSNIIKMQETLKATLTKLQ